MTTNSINNSTEGFSQQLDDTGLASYENSDDRQGSQEIPIHRIKLPKSNSSEYSLGIKKEENYYCLSSDGFEVIDSDTDHPPCYIETRWTWGPVLLSRSLNAVPENVKGFNKAQNEGVQENYPTPPVPMPGDTAEYGKEDCGGCNSHWEPIDADGDGQSPMDGDCWDASSGPTGSGLESYEIYYGATETWYDGYDQDCMMDDDYDQDGDGYVPDAYVGLTTLGVTGSGALPGGDCDDTDPTINPEADEYCDGIDTDCDGVVDNDYALDAVTFYEDADGDDFGNYESQTMACEAPEGYTADHMDCDDTDFDINPDTLWYRDADADTYGDPNNTRASCTWIYGYVDNADDCDDTDPTVNPDKVWYEDYDGDGYGINAITKNSCEQPSGYAEVDLDCDDTEATINPDADEYCDGVDNDCDGTVDERDAIDSRTWYRDGDADGYGVSGADVGACYAPSGYVDNNTDCADSDSSIYPGAEELCHDGVDSDCDGDDGGTNAIDGTTWYLDLDGDSFGDSTNFVSACESDPSYVSDASDCDDTDAAINPDADELCDGIDNDCDSSVDEDDAIDATTWYQDMDVDGFGDPSSTFEACSQPTGYVADSTDCDDDRAQTNPSAGEYCNDIDDDCDGDTDEAAIDASTWYLDSDGDTFGDPSASTRSCEVGTSYVSDMLDCDDTDAAVNPDADEVCDGIDNDCDSSTDDSSATDALYWFEDLDGDGYGTTGGAIVACEQPSGYIDNDDDCDDYDAAVNPGAVEDYTNETDDDCDGTIDDKDGDGFTFTLDNDCDDDDASVNPDATEICDGIDNDCDGTPDESDAADASTWYADADGDGFGDSFVSQDGCTAPSGYVADDADCDDTDASVYPGAIESCNLIDDDCDGTVDEPEDTSGIGTWYRDQDGDGFGDPVSSMSSCTPGSSYVSDDSDCDDLDAAVNPDASETCNSVDDDCDGDVDEDDAIDALPWYLDADGDGFGDSFNMMMSCLPYTSYVSDLTDCDDADATVNPDASEVCNGVDDNCDGDVDEGSASGAVTWFQDLDGDGYGTLADSVMACEQPSGYIDNHEDCDDDDAFTFPGAEEICFDGVNSDCDTEDDDGYVCTTSTENASVQISDSTSGTSAGAAVSFVGDTNADGFEDFVVGAYATDGTYSDEGAAYFFQGPVTADMTFASANASLTGSENAHYLGHSVNGGGDVDADGFADLLIGGSGYDATSSNEGAVYLISGPVSGSTMTSSATLTGADASGMAGWSCSNQGDYNNDGFDDVLVGAPYANSGTGAGYIKNGSVTGSVSLADAEATLLGESSSDQAGIAVAYAGDTNADGIDDLLVGAHGNDDGGSLAGAVYLSLGPVTGSLYIASADGKLIGETAGDFAGYAVSGAGDMNADGYDDILTGAYGYGASNEGACYGVFGPISGIHSLSSADIIVEGEGADDRTGISVASVGDVDGDGHVDIAYGAAYSDTSDTDAGLGYLMYGPMTASYHTALISSLIPSAHFGRSVDGGDVNADGYDDLLWGAMGSSSTNGSAFLFYGDEN